jgi:hypothetical protein
VSHLTVAKGRVGGTATILAGGARPFSRFMANRSALFTLYGKKNVLFKTFGEMDRLFSRFGRIDQLFSRRFLGKYVIYLFVKSRAPLQGFSRFFGGTSGQTQL